jgi:ferritin-like metal-binding protein YciE
MAVRSLQELFIEELRDMYHAEKQLARALPKMAKAANSERLQQAFQEHTEVTKAQIERLQQVFESISSPARAKRCEAMEGLIEEAQEMLDEDISDELLDVALIASAQKVEHYEIAGYGTLRTLAQQLGHQEAARLLEETLNEEKQTDELLNEIALNEVNQNAMQSEEEEEEMETAGASKSKTSGTRSKKK